VSRSSASSLADLQRAFQDYLLQSSDGFVASVRDTKKASRELLLGVYRDAYTLRLIEVLGIDYPGVMAMCGPADFDYLARAYIAAHPSHHPSVRWFGAKLADFLSLTPPFSGTPAVAEMARFEWALGEAFDSVDAEPVQAEALMALPPDAWLTLRFTTLPSLQRLKLAFAVPQAYQQRDDVEPGNLEVAREEQAPVEWAIWRPQHLSLFRSLEPDEAALLGALIAGRTFPEICEAAAQFTDEAQATARTAALLRSWVEEGMIAGYGVGEIP
jgi:hypothetical protein